MKDLTRDEHVVIALAAVNGATLEDARKKDVLRDLWDAAYSTGAREQGTHNRDMERLARARAGAAADDDSDYVAGLIAGIGEERARWRVVLPLLPDNVRHVLAILAVPLSHVASASSPGDDTSSGYVHVSWRLTHEEWREVRGVLWDNRTLPHIQKLASEGKLAL